MFASVMESIGTMGNSRRDPTVITSETFARTPTATSAAYKKALEKATAATKANFAKLYPRDQEVPHSAIRIVRGSIEAVLPHEQHNGHQLEETRDQPTQGNGRGLSMRAERDDPATLFVPPKSYQLTSGHTIHTIPINKQRILFPGSSYDQGDKFNGKASQEDIEAKHLLQKILHLDAEVTEATAAVYHYFETNIIDDEVSASGRALEVIHYIREELRKGNSKPAYQFLETARTVLPVIREEAALELEVNIFSEDSEDSEVFTPRSAAASTQHDDMRSISEQTAAIFQFLDDAKSLERSHRQSEDPSGSKVTESEDSNGNIFRILEEKEVRAMENEELNITQFPKTESKTDFGDISNFNAPDVDDMDLEFVENFDLAYSEFLFFHPKLVAKNPELMRNLRIYKLQKLLEYNEILEQNSLDTLKSMYEEKKATEESMYSQLKDAVKKKAARQTFLQSEVNDINWKTKQLQAKLRWKVFKYSEDRAKRQLKLREQFRTIPLAKTREQLIPLIPEGPYSKKLETAIKASFIAEGSSIPDLLTSKQLDQLKSLQVENAVKNSEINMLTQKLAQLQNEAKQVEWVQSTLTELDSVTLKKFKEQFEKKEGVPL